tara:strand:- start:36 stop:422 length:387 start_codon:yes stop_codon:yes gene_type:complete
MNDKKNLPSNKNFGITFFVVFFLIALYPLSYGGDIRIWSISTSLILLTLGLINSNILTPLNKLWFKVGFFLGKIISPIIMSIIFFFIVTPIGLIMRLLGKDLLKLKYNKSKSYWIEKNGEKSEMKNQF